MSNEKDLTNVDGESHGLEDYADLHHKDHAAMTATPAELGIIENPQTAFDVEMDDAEMRRLLRKIDIAIVPCKCYAITRFALAPG